MVYVIRYGVPYGSQCPLYTDEELRIAAYSVVVYGAQTHVGHVYIDIARDICAQMIVLSITTDHSWRVNPEFARPILGNSGLHELPAAFLPKPPVTEAEQKALNLATDIVGAAYNLIDNTSEEDDPSEERKSIFVAEEYDVDKLNELFDKADALCPDDEQPGYLMGPTAKIFWKLRRLLPTSD